MQTKICTKCKAEKYISEFYKSSRGLHKVRSDCKKCRAQYKKEYYLKTLSQYQSRNKLWFKNNKNKRKEYERKRSKLPKRKIANSIRVRMREALKENYKSSILKYIGCSIEELKKHLELQFQSGMNWENHSQYGWHIDHIKPLISFDLTKEEKLYEACHYTNLQPLWWRDNLSKGAKV